MHLLQGPLKTGKRDAYEVPTYNIHAEHISNATGLVLIIIFCFFFFFLVTYLFLSPTVLSKYLRGHSAHYEFDRDGYLNAFVVDIPPSPHTTRSGGNLNLTTICLFMNRRDKDK